MGQFIQHMCPSSAAGHPVDIKRVFDSFLRVKADIHLLISRLRATKQPSGKLPSLFHYTFLLHNYEYLFSVVVGGGVPDFRQILQKSMQR